MPEDLGERPTCACRRPAVVRASWPSDDPDRPVSMLLCEDRFAALRKRRNDLTVSAV